VRLLATTLVGVLALGAAAGPALAAPWRPGLPGMPIRSALAQDPQGPPPPGPRAGPPGRGLRGGEPPVTAAQAEQVFDRYVLAQARTALQLTPDQVGPFARRMALLQAVRRRGQRERQRLLNDLNAASRAGGADDEAALAGKMKALDDLDARVDQDVRDAYARVEAILTLRQRARFRIFEQRMARQKLDLIARARRMAAGDGAVPP
jgi:hypothetical protein